MASWRDLGFFGFACAASVGLANRAAAQCVADPGGVVINEFLVNPDGNDSQVLLEWVELYNGGGDPVDVTGWEIRKATAGDAYGLEATMPPDTVIGAGGFLLVGEANVAGADVVVSGTMALGTGANGDGVQLRDCLGAIVDTVVYGDADNGQGVVDDSGAPATSVAPRPGTDESVARRVDGADTDRSGDDFWVPPVPTPGAPNPAPPACTPSTGDDVKINEFVANPAGSDADAEAEYVELYHTGAGTLSLGGWQLQASTNGSWRTRVTLPDGAAIAGGGFFVIGEANVFPRDHLPASALSLGSGTRGDGIRLVDCEGWVVDTVVYGDDNTDGILDDRGRTDSYADKPGDDEAIARIEDGVDTDRSGDDFFLTEVQTPGARNPGAPSCETSRDVVINEFLANPSGADGEVLLEWVELYNGADVPVYLDGWTIRTASAEDGYTVKATLPEGTRVEADGHLLVGERNVPGADVVVDGTLGLGSGLRGDGVRLVDCDGDRVDTVVFGDPTNEDEVVDDSGAPAVSVAPKPSDDVSLARRRDGLDTDRSGDDFVPSSAPTPGAANPTFTCFPSTGDVLLNEVLPDPSGSDGETGLEWVELYNRSGDPLRVDGWQLIFATNGDDWAADVLLPPEASVPALGFLVVGAENVEEADIVVPMSIGNGSGGDAVRLVDCEGTVVDVVVYGDANEDGLLDESGNLAVSVGRPGSDESIARVEDGADTDAAEDWVIDRSPSPGASNVQVVDTDVDTDTGGGCRRGAPEGDAPGGCGNQRPPSAERGCVTVLPMGGLEVLVASLVAVGRRRRTGVTRGGGAGGAGGPGR